MKIALNNLLPQFLPAGIDHLCIPHDGKSHLKKLIPIRIRAWMGDVRFVIVHDKDSADCKALKKDLRDMAAAAGRPDTLVRIACTELESWFLGDFDALEMAYSISLSGLRNRAKYRDPDRLANAKQELRLLISDYHQLDGSRRISAHMRIERNTSQSFQALIKGVKELCNERV